MLKKKIRLHKLITEALCNENAYLFKGTKHGFLKKLVTEHGAVYYVSTFALAPKKLDHGFIGCGSFFISLGLLSWASALLPLFFGSESQVLQVEHLTRGVTNPRCFVSFSFYPCLLLNLAIVVFNFTFVFVFWPLLACWESW